ncbi:hypothetical protein BT93_L4962 [Corymbia citriodora subsp. variegata]|uniref:B box-type domain-containing protein n=1 Tax=Corymbia citriodora subsp. variegata TaxID=360336 RepID=A0A8T0CUK8_CORYI|nr:hypothetical protein BT93_L4962 [Corymbia citriodora subsp. variegata]
MVGLWVKTVSLTASEAMVGLGRGDQEKVVPRWLRLILSAKFYSSCETHHSKERNYFCRVCMLALCKDCKRQHDHSKHEILTAYKASHAASFRMEDLKPLWDISGICPYTFNGWLVAFIYKKGTGLSRPRCKSGVAECESCRYALKSPSAKYCSLECKVEAALKMNGSGNTNEKAKRKLETTLAEIAHSVHSVRKRARKQEKPQRAPFH